MSRYFYTGDIHIENGGTFYSLENWKYDFVDFVRCQPCSDAGGPENEWRIEVGTVNIPDADSEHFAQARSCIGMSREDFEAYTKAQQRHIMFDACLCYGLYDVTSIRRIRIGKKPESHPRYWDEREPDDIYRGNSSLMRIVRKVVRGEYA
jgi:hypothetical protein